MPKHPKFTGDHLTDTDHQACIGGFGHMWDSLVVPLFDGFDLYLRGRVHKPYAPCLRVFRSRELYEAEQRGLIFHVQPALDLSYTQVVFRKSRGFHPLPAEEWNVLEPDFWQPSRDSWKGPKIRSPSEIDSARDQIRRAVSAYDGHFTDS